MLGLLCAAGLCSAAPAPGEAPPPPGPIALVHVEANVDAAAGGHVALRVGAQVHHFLNSDSGTLRHTRSDWRSFRRLYADLQNRDLHLLALDLQAEDARAVREHCTRRWLHAREEERRLRERQSDARWWAALRDGTPPPALPGTGLLSRRGGSAAGRSLRDALAQRHGADFATLRLQELDLRCSRALPENGGSLRALREAWTEREVVQSLATGTGVAPAALVEAGREQGLGDQERRSLELLLESQRDSVLRLWHSSRPDRGRALAVAAARHHAAWRSLDEGRLLLLDSFPDHAERLRPDAEQARLSYGPMCERAERILRRLRDEVLDGGRPRESSFARLEEAATRRLEAERGARGEEVRLSLGHSLPSRGRSPEGPLPHRLPAEALARHAARAEQDARRTEEDLQDARDYHLLRHNCATTIVELLNGAFADDAEVERALGARLRPGAGGSFVPWVLAEQVRQRLHVAEESTERSLLRRHTDRLREEDAAPWRRWREASPLTSAVIPPDRDDGHFLFFTDEAPWLRPLRGTANLGYGLLWSGVGVLSAPLDGGENLRAGAHGVLYSLPELLFVNVRKGSVRSVPPTRAPSSQR